jgi:hypothetical protein
LPIGNYRRSLFNHKLGGYVALPVGVVLLAAGLITPNQCREARRLLGWSRHRLTALCEVSVYFIASFERGKEVSQGKVDAIRAALEAAGVEFIEQNGGGPGVQLRARSDT